ncbi:L-threonine 3-dehydrogenase [Alkalicoccus urumqiensis]|uniref:L-threonine 3-dehydrogenase n=1 Tax=Alkalicoccus urumqiensis TaxID=1548213 RepID=A0A2P6MFU5_ALKUR|nr:L-threonine 3-dehydrogenase [Alkalicoccus urumqiensis]PRO65165.1 L-threonine 3-dehydrogenase [Alkalicoccus urumqiensis]
MMKALMKTSASAGAELKTVPIPEPGPGEVQIKIETMSICGTDLHIYEWDDWAAGRINTPYIFGHEFSGVISEIGRGVEGLEPGERCSAETHIVCGKCRACRSGKAHVCLNTSIIGVDRDGSFAEYIVVPQENVIVNHPSIPARVNSLQEPFGNAVHTVLSGQPAGRSTAVVGCGPIGLMAVCAAKACGASRVLAFDVNEYRLDLARKAGADVIINPAETDMLQAALQETGGVDVVCEMSGNPQAFDAALKMTAQGGHMAVLSLPPTVPVRMTEDVVFKGITIQGITGRRMYETWLQVQGLLASGQVDLEPLITHEFKLEEFAAGFNLMKEGNCGKIILRP